MRLLARGTNRDGNCLGCGRYQRENEREIALLSNIIPICRSATTDMRRPAQVVSENVAAYHYPFTQICGSSRATLRDSPAFSAASATAVTSL